MLATPWSDQLGLGAPVLNAPMGGVAGGELAAAVSAAGGLGMIGVGSAGSVQLIEREVPLVQATGLPFGIGLLDWALQEDPALLEAALGASPRLIGVSFGDEWTWVERVRSAGVLTATQICTVEEARHAQDAGIDVVVARGAEGGGHGDPRIGTLPLLDGVLDAVSLPVLASGGISSPRGLAAVLTAGASGAWIGTAFAASPESLTSGPARTALLEADETDTVVTRVFDIAFGYRWPARYPERILTGSLSDEWIGREREVSGEWSTRAALVEAVRAEGGSAGHVNAGQGVGMLTEVRLAADVIEWLCSGAAALLGGWSR
ncbi:MAG: NAD(P)H-dependent flavin oxidoreductase [Acidimicrobiales bacterium]